MNERCSCCEGIIVLTPGEVANRPGLPALSYRVGTHATFLQTMQARLSSHRLLDAEGRPTGAPLQQLRTRATQDPTIALLDAWATVADVLTFYQERIANEGYLRTATERFSIVELARLIGYTPRPGVSATAFLAYTLDPNGKVTIPAGNRAQSIPDPGQTAQTFETAEALEARAEWNTLPLRKTRPQKITDQNYQTLETLTLAGVATNLKPGDALIFAFSKSPVLPLRFVKEVEPHFGEDYTTITLLPLSIPNTPPALPDEDSATLPSHLSLLSGSITKSPTQPPINRFHLAGNVTNAFSSKGDTLPQLIQALHPSLVSNFYPALANLQVTPPDPVEVYALRVKAAPFGHNAPKQIALIEGRTPSRATTPIPARLVPTGITVPQNTIVRTTLSGEWPLTEEDKNLEQITLDAQYDSILSGSWIVIVRPGLNANETISKESEALIRRVEKTETVSRADYGVSGKVTRLTLNKPWLETQLLGSIEKEKRSLLRQTTVYALNELLPRAEEPILEDVCLTDTIELDGVYGDLKPGRWVIISGERDINHERNPSAEPTPPSKNGGVRGTERAMLAGVSHDFNPDLLGDKVHTHLVLSAPLAYCYKRKTVTIFGNVVKATHGQTQEQVLGSGEASQTFQQFPLLQSPLTYLAAPTPVGAESTVQVRVNDLLWQEADSLAGLGPTDRRYLLKTGDDAKTRVIFGNGVAGARPSTGVENITTKYRSGIGKPGNLRAGQISLLMERPLGVKEVVNPLPSTGGADREDRDQARSNAPRAVTALDRLVSVQDYEDFARTFAGIGKAKAALLSNGHRRVVHVTIAGLDDIPIDTSSDLYRNLFEALHRYGDPHQPLQLAVAQRLLLVLAAKVRVLPNYLWEKVEPQIRAALLDRFGFQRQELGQDVVLSEVLRVMQRVPGVDYVDVDVLEAIGETDIEGGVAKALTAKKPSARLSGALAQSDTQKGLQSAQIAFFSPALPDILLLNRL